MIKILNFFTEWLTSCLEYRYDLGCCHLNSVLCQHVVSLLYLNLKLALISTQVGFVPMLTFRINHSALCAGVTPVGLLARSSSAQGLLLV